MNSNRLLSGLFAACFGLGSFGYFIFKDNVWSVWIPPLIVVGYWLIIIALIRRNAVGDVDLATDSVYYLGFGLTIVSLGLLSQDGQGLDRLRSHFATGLWTTSLGLVGRVSLNMVFSSRAGVDDAQAEQEILARRLRELNSKIDDSAGRLSDVIDSQVSVLVKANDNIAAGVAETAERLAGELAKISDAMKSVGQFATSFRDDNPFLALDEEVRKAVSSISLVLKAQEDQLKKIGAAGVKQTALFGTSIEAVAAAVDEIKATTIDIQEAVRRGADGFASLDKQLNQVSASAAGFAAATGVVTKRQDEAAIAIERTTVALQSSLVGAAEQIKSLEPSSGAFKAFAGSISNLQLGSANLTKEMDQIAKSLSDIRRDMDSLEKSLQSATGSFNVVSRIGSASATQLNQGFGGILSKMQQLLEELRRRNP